MLSLADINLHASWLDKLHDELEQPYMQQLREFIASEQALGKLIYPSNELIFNALNSTPFEQVKVVILGQDPYHGPGQAHGLCFSVPHGVRAPPSLVNIFKEVKGDMGLPLPAHGNLEKWAAQGVLLLNSVLTVEHKRAASHANKGWERFTDRVIELLSEQRSGLVFLLWGSYAQKKGRIIDEGKHLVLKSVHPSPLSAYRGFFGSGHFSAANKYMAGANVAPIDWRI